MININIYPNRYKINYEDYKGNKRISTMTGLTSNEAIVRFRSKNTTTKKVSAVYDGNNI